MTASNQPLALVEIGLVILSGFVASYAMKTAGGGFFALPHLVFLLVALFARSVLSNWKLADYGFTKDIPQQIRLGVLIWVIVQTYYSILHIFAPLFPEAARIGATIFKITTLEGLTDAIISIALFKAGVLESLRYFAYAEGLLIQVFGPSLGTLMAFAYFGSAHMGVMNLIVLPVSLLFVYFYRTYRLIVPLIVFHALGDAGGFVQNYFSYHGMYAYNYAFFILLFGLLVAYRHAILDALAPISKALLQDLMWLRNHKLKAGIMVLILPMWLHLLLFLERNSS